MCLKDTARDVQSNLPPCSEKLLQEDFELTCCGGMNYNSIHFNHVQTTHSVKIERTKGNNKCKNHLPTNPVCFEVK